MQRALGLLARREHSMLELNASCSSVVIRAELTDPVLEAMHRESTE